SQIVLVLVAVVVLGAQCDQRELGASASAAFWDKNSQQYVSILHFKNVVKFLPWWAVAPRNWHHFTLRRRRGRPPGAYNEDRGGCQQIALKTDPPSWFIFFAKAFWVERKSRNKSRRNNDYVNL